MKTLTLITLLLLTGCSINTYKEKLTFHKNAQEVAVYESRLEQWLFLYFTKTKQVDHRGPLSSMSVGDITSVPDANSIEAAFEGAASGLVGGI